MTRFLAWCILTTWFVQAGIAVAQLNKCVGADGKTAYQSEPCQANQKNFTVDAPTGSGVSIGSASAGVSDVERKYIQGFTCLVLFDRRKETAWAETFDAWEGRNRGPLAPIVGDPASQKRHGAYIVEQRREARTLPASLPGKRSACDTLMSTLSP